MKQLAALAATATVVTAAVVNALPAHQQQGSEPPGRVQGRTAALGQSVSQAEPRSGRDRAVERKVDALLRRMTVEEKLQQVQLLSDGQVTDEDARAGVGGVFSLVDPARIDELQHIAVEESRLGIPILFAYDTMTLIGPGTWEAARGAADAAISAAELVVAAADGVDGPGAAYALCRPPGHHATRKAIGGSCYLNNAALAAATLRERLGGPVAVIDIDAHHGNGTEAIFADDPSVLTGSVHVDPAAGWFPHFLGFEDAGGAHNRNLTLSPGSGDAPWLEAISRLAAWARDGGARSLVVPLGVDAAGGDPESPLDVTLAGYGEGGRILGGLGLPTVIVQEGGYDLATIGDLVVTTLRGFEAARG